MHTSDVDDKLNSVCRGFVAANAHLVAIREALVGRL